MDLDNNSQSFGPIFGSPNQATFGTTTGFGGFQNVNAAPLNTNTFGNNNNNTNAGSVFGSTQDHRYQFGQSVFGSSHNTNVTTNNGNTQSFGPIFGSTQTTQTLSFTSQTQSGPAFGASEDKPLFAPRRSGLLQGHIKPGFGMVEKPFKKKPLVNPLVQQPAEATMDSDDGMATGGNLSAEVRKQAFLKLREANKKIFISLIPPEVNTEPILRAAFAQAGEIESIHCIPHKKTAFIEFKNKNDAFNGLRIKSIGPHKVKTEWAKIDNKAVAQEAAHLVGPQGGHDLEEITDIDDVVEETVAPPKPVQPVRPTIVPQRLFQPEAVKMRPIKEAKPPQQPPQFVQQPLDEEQEIEAEPQPVPSKFVAPAPKKKPPTFQPLGQQAPPVKNTMPAAQVPEKSKEDRAQRFESKTDSLQRLQELQTKSKTEKQVIVPRNLEDAEAVIGTCMDMCPEKERLNREQWGDLTVFEMEPGTENDPTPRVKHEWAVKKYARPSVNLEGTEIPPEEIRPAPVLKKTMEYLRENIMDRTDHPFYEVHNFIRDRTRGIRQDFTLQHLNDLLAVNIHEQIARFHILSEHRLCEEEGTNFESKMNMEQLNKCLISLKQMYEDHRKQGMEINTESEFRAYFVLTHIDGDVVEYCGQMHPSVLRSKEVQFVLQIWRTMKENNYVKYFKLVKEAPYLTACLMHKYFNRVRSSALRTMKKAYVREDYPVAHLVPLMQFEDLSEAIAFCEYYGYEVNDNMIVFSKSNPISPKVEFSRRISQLIEEKTDNIPIKNIVTGTLATTKPIAGVLPVRSVPKPAPVRPVEPKPAVVPTPAPAPVVQNSSPFKRESPLLKTTLPPLKVPSPTPVPVPEQPASPHVDVETVTPVGSIAIPPFVAPVPLSPKAIKPVEPDRSLEIEMERQRQLKIRMEQERIQEEMRQKADRERKERELVALRLQEEQRQREQERIRQQELEAQRQRAIAQEKLRQEQLLQQRIKEENERKERERQLRLAQLRDRVKRRKMLDMVHLWRHKTAIAVEERRRKAELEQEKKRRWENALKGDVIDTSMLASPFRVQWLLSHSKMSPKALKSPLEQAKTRQYLDSYLMPLRRTAAQRLENSYHPIEMGSLLYGPLRTINPGSMHLYFKMVIASRGAETNNEDTLIWLLSKFRKGGVDDTTRPGVDTLSSYSIDCSTVNSLDTNSKLHVSIKHLFGSPMSSELYGVHQILFALDVDPNQNVQWNQEQARLKQLLQEVPKGTLPVLLLAHTLPNTQEMHQLVVDKIELQNFPHLFDIVSRVEVVSYSETSQLGSVCSSTTLEQTIKNSTAFTRPQPILMCDSLSEHFDSKLMEVSQPLLRHFYTRYQGMERPDFQVSSANNTIPSYTLETACNCFVVAFNFTVDKLSETIEETSKLIWPLPDFIQDGEHLPNLGWNSEGSIQRLTSKLSAIKLPPKTFPSITQPSQMKDSVLSAISHYVKQLEQSLPQDRQRSPSSGQSRLVQALSQINFIVNQHHNKITEILKRHQTQSTEIHSALFAYYFPWHKVFEQIYNMRVLQLEDIHGSEEVFFIKCDIPPFDFHSLESTPPSLKHQLLRPPTIQEAEEEKLTKKQRVLDHEIMEDVDNLSPPPAPRSLLEAPAFYKDTHVENSLVDKLNQEMDESLSFDNFLKNAADGIMFPPELNNAIPNQKSPMARLSIAKTPQVEPMRLLYKMPTHVASSMTSLITRLQDAKYEDQLMDDYLKQCLDS